MSNVFNNWCPEIYRSVFIDRFNDDYVKVAPCCQAMTKLEPVNVFDFKNSPYLNQLRKEFDQGLRPKACNSCWTVEDHGHKSRRLSAIEFFQDQVPDNQVQLQSLDHSATWACNLACIMCGPHSSSTWATEQNLNRDDLKKLGRLFQKSNNILNQLDLSQIKKVHFNGGEPMLNGDQITLLTKLDQKNVLKDVFISYNTNGTVMPDKKIVDMWSRCGLVKIFFSIDAIEKAFEYVRWPANWNETKNNMLSMKADLPGNVMFGFNTTVGAYNLFEMPDVYAWFEQNLSTNRDGDASDFCWQLVKNFFSDIKRLPESAKHEAIKQLEHVDAMSGIVGYLESNINYSTNLNWIKTLQDLDAVRNTDWKKVLKISNYIKETMC